MSGEFSDQRAKPNKSEPKRIESTPKCLSPQWLPLTNCLSPDLPDFLNHKEHEFLVGHLLRGLRSRSVKPTAYPVIPVVGIHAEFYGLEGDG